MKKRLLSTFLTFCMVMTLLPVTALAAGEDSVTEGGMLNGYIGPGGPYDTFAVEDGVLTGYIGPGEDVLIPDGVTVVGSDVFAECKNLMSVTVPDSVTAIGENAFANCTGLTDVYYGGDEAQWEAIDIAQGNEALISADIHYASDSARPDALTVPAGIGGELSGAAPVGAVEDPVLGARLEEYIRNKNINGNNISIAYYNTVSGVQYLWNGDRYFTAASIYKLPLNMYYYELEAAGKVSSDARYGGYPLSYCHKQSLQYSNNELSQAMRAGLGSYREFKTLIAKYGGVPAEKMPEIYYSGNYFNTAFILNTLKVLYDRRDFFSEAIGYLKDAHPGQWFETSLPDSECTVAQKYGAVWTDHGYFHTAGIIYADEPFLLVVFTQDVASAERVVIGEIARICYDYTQANVGAWKNRVANFWDVFITDWYAEAVAHCAERGIISGTSNTTFSPNNALTRAMFVTMLGRFSGVDGSGTFEDVNYGDYYSSYVEWAYQNGIASGVDETHFAPNNPITREQAAVMLYRCLTVQDLAPPSGDGSFEDFSDADQISSYAREAVDALHACGIFSGDSDERFNPQDNLTRAQSAVLFMRMEQIIESSEE